MVVLGGEEECLTMIVKLSSKLVGAGLYHKRMCSQAQQLRTTVIGKRQRKNVLVLTKAPRMVLA